MANVGILVYEALLEYFLENKKTKLPENIIFYRDGVGDDQMVIV